MGLATGAPRPTLCVGMATYDDFDGVWFTVQSLRLSHPELADVLSFVVVDNNPGGIASESLAALEALVPGYRYVPFSGYRGTAVRDLVFREAQADVVCCVDSHVLLAPGAMTALLDWFAAHPDSTDLLQGPLWYDDLTEQVSTHLEPTWGTGMFGQWGTDERGRDRAGEPFEIRMQGLGLFACRREAWVGLNPRLRGFGGEEGYLQEKVRQRGGRVLCHPGVRWVHRFQRPAGAPYANTWPDRVRNYLIGWSEIGADTAEVLEHFRGHLGTSEEVEALLAKARWEAASPLMAVDAVFCPRGAAAGVGPQAELGWRVEELDVPSGAEGAAATALLWREAVTQARHRSYASFLLVEGAVEVLSGGVDLAGEADLVPLPVESAAEAATVVRARAYAQLLSDLPGDTDQAAAFVRTWGSVRGYLDDAVSRGALSRVEPPPAPTAPAVERPLRAPGLAVEPAHDGLLVTAPDGRRTCHLNTTSALVLQLADGLLTERQIALVLADEFALEAPPAQEVATTLATFRELGLLV